MKRNANKRFKALCSGLLLLACGHSGAAWAACALASGIPNYHIDQVRDVIADAALAPGTPLGRDGFLSVPAGRWRFNCIGGSSPIYLSHSMQSAAVNGLFEFTVNGGQPSGVGIRLSVADAGGAKRPFPFSQQLNVPAGEFTQSSDYYTSLERVGGAPVVYGRVDTIQLATSFLFNGTGPVGAPIPYRRIHIRDFVLVSPSCSIDAGSLRQTVSLGNHVSSDFDNGVGWTPFDLVMGNCSDLSLLEEITFGSLSDADADAPGLFSMNASGPSGLGIAIRTRGGVLSPMLPGQSQIFPAVLTGQVFPFEARLERTVGPVSQGAINRPVVVTVNFR